MTTIQVQRKTELRSIIAICKIWVEEERLDVLWLLNNYENSDLFTKGEMQSVQKYLRNYFGFVDSEGSLTNYARSQRDKEKTIFRVPESGIYKLFLFSDPYESKEYPVGFEREGKYASNDVKDGYNFEEYQSIQNRVFTSWSIDQSGKFQLNFIKDKSVRFPQIIKDQTLSANIKLEIKEEGNRYNVYTNNKKFEYTQNHFEYLDFDTVCKQLISDWDSVLKSQRITFTNAKEIDAQFNFKRSLSIESVLPFSSENNDDSLYKITITNIPLIPSDENEAKEWMTYLLKEELKKEVVHLTFARVKEILYALFQRTGMDKHYQQVVENYNISELLHDLQEDDSTLYWKIRMAEDLIMR